MLAFLSKTEIAPALSVLVGLKATQQYPDGTQYLFKLCALLQSSLSTGAEVWSTFGKKKSAVCSIESPVI